MYLRNVKQILRQADGGFDERRYGFGGLMDLLKACQRAGFVRIERDRRGGLRVFQGSALQGAGAARPTYANLPQPDVEDTMEAPSYGESQTAFIEPLTPAPVDVVEDEVIDMPQPTVDPTAEMLGRATGKARARTPNGCPGSPVQVTDDRRRFVKARQSQRIGGRHVQSAQPDAMLVLTALHQRIGE